MDTNIKKIDQKETIKKVFYYIKRYWFCVVGSILLAGINVVASLFVLKLIGEAIDQVVGVGAVDFTELYHKLFTMMVCIVLVALTGWGMNVINNKAVYHIIQDIRKDAFNQIEKLPLKFIDQKSYGDIVSRVIADVDQFADGLLMGFTQLFTGVLTILGTLIFMFRENFYIALVVVLLTPISIFVANFIAKKTYYMFKKQSELRGEQTALIDEMIGNQKVVQAFSYEEEAAKRFFDINERLSKASIKAIFYSSITNPATRFVNGLVYTGVGISGALSVILGGLSVGSLVSFLNFANQYTKPFNEISGVITELQNALACARRIFELMEEEHQIPDAKDAKVLNSVKGEINLKSVCFSYQPDKKFIENLNLYVKPGQRIAIVGPTGCGKTTIINLLMRFYEINSGCITVDAFDIKDITRKSLRTNFGMVLQETWLKTGTIRENIILGKPEASEEEIMNAAKLAHVHSVIKRLPDGYNTMISEEGGGLSQGEKQLLCIARVMLCLPPMLILDEATSSIDTRTEIKIQKAFMTLMQGRTSFIIAHRLSTIKDADIILVMKDGHIIEQGNHQELIKKQGFYFELYNSQFAENS